MDSCITIAVPANHSVMVSLVSLDLAKCCDCDFVQVFVTNVCSAIPAETHCYNRGLTATVYETEHLSVRFRSNGNNEASGFRLLFSFHHSAQNPVRLSNGKWDCAVPEPSVLLQHFACSPHTFCDGGEDRAEGRCPSSDICGPNIIRLGGRCYRRVRPLRPISWEEAEDTCKSNHGYLVSLNTQQEWDSLRTWMTAARHYESQHILVGLKLRTFPLRNV